MPLVATFQWEPLLGFKCMNMPILLQISMNKSKNFRGSCPAKGREAPLLTLPRGATPVSTAPASSASLGRKTLKTAEL